MIQDESDFINKVVVPGIELDRIMTIFDGVIIYKEDETIADKFFDKLELGGCPIKFGKGEVPESKKEVSHAV